MKTSGTSRTELLVLASSALLLGVVLLVAGVPAWAWVSVFVLAGITGLGAVAAPATTRGERGE